MYVVEVNLVDLDFVAEPICVAQTSLCTMDTQAEMKIHSI